jgi:hypothetical protein
MTPRAARSAQRAAAQTPADELAEFIPFEEFRNGLPFGRFHVVVDPQLAPRFVAAKINALPLAIALIGCGVAAALAGHAAAGVVLVMVGVLLRRWVRRQAGPILVFLASRIASVYASATEHGVMEVQRLKT